jgi:four helix bundle protein
VSGEQKANIRTVNGSANEKPHKRLLAWQRSMDLFVEIHKLTGAFPANEQYLVVQMRRAALSAPSNIAEGAADQTRAQFAVFLGYAVRSLNEVQTQLEAARRVGLVTAPQEEAAAALIDECLRLTYGLKRSL